MNYHPDVRLRLLDVTVLLRYDGSVGLVTACEVIGRDGTKMQHGSVHAHRIKPNAWHGLTLPEAIGAAFHAHHDHLGLNRPPELGEHAPLHLHPQGFPGTQTHAPVPDAPDAPLPDEHAAKVAAYIVRAKEAEMAGGGGPGAGGSAGTAAPESTANPEGQTPNAERQAPIIGPRQYPLQNPDDHGTAPAKGKQS